MGIFGEGYVYPTFRSFYIGPNIWSLRPAVGKIADLPLVHSSAQVLNRDYECRVPIARKVGVELLERPHLTSIKKV